MISLWRGVHPDHANAVRRDLSGPAPVIRLKPGRWHSTLPVNPWPADAARAESWRAALERSPLVDLSPQETMALIQVANAGARAGTVAESDLSRLHLLGLVEQRGMSMGLTAMGIQAIARLKHG
jgi:hypothetical protein